MLNKGLYNIYLKGYFLLLLAGAITFGFSYNKMLSMQQDFEEIESELENETSLLSWMTCINHDQLFEYVQVFNNPENVSTDKRYKQRVDSIARLELKVLWSYRKFLTGNREYEIYEQILKQWQYCEGMEHLFLSTHGDRHLLRTRFYVLADYNEHIHSGIDALSKSVRKRLKEQMNEYRENLHKLDIWISFLLWVGLISVLVVTYVIMYYFRRVKRNQAGLRQLLEQKELAERAALATTSYYRQFFENAPDSILCIDRDKNIRFVNKIALDMFSYAEDELVGLSVHQLFDGFIDLEEGKSAMNDNLVDGRRKDGHKFLAEIHFNNYDISEQGLQVLIVRDTSERNEIRKRLSESEGNLRAILNNSTEFIWSVDKELRLITFNSIFSERFRLSFGMMPRQGQVFTGFFPPEYRGVMEEKFRQVFEGKHVEFEFSMPAPDKVYYYTISLHPIYERENVTAVSCFSVDNTESIIAQRKLSESEKNLKAIFENSSEMICSVDRDHRLTFFNKAFGREYKRQSGKTLVLGAVPYEFLDVKTVNFWKQKTNTALNGEVAFFDFSYELKGRFKCFLMSFYPMVEDGKVTGVSVFSFDTTQQKIAQKKLADSEKNLKGILENSMEMIWSLKLDGTLIIYNRSFAQQYEEFTGNKVVDGFNALDALTGEARDIMQHKLERVFAGELVSWEQSIRFRGTVQYFKLLMYPIYEDTVITAATCVAHEITAQKIAETERDRSTRDLILRNKDLEQFAYIVSHNLRSPLANIMGLTSRLMVDSADRQQQKILLNYLLNSVTRMDQVIKDLDAILQINRDITEKKEDIVLSYIIDDIKQSIINIIQQEDVIIKTDFEGVDHIRTLKSYLYSIFYNLITNSIKYRRREERPIISISGRKSGNHVLITYQDNGMGIDMDIHGDKIFGLYKRFHGNVDGKGMGLFMVRKQVEALRGSIKVNSKVNMGTQFEIEIPYE